MTVSRRPKRATSAAVLGVLLVKSRLGIRGGYSHGHRLSLHARPLDASLKWDFCCYFVNIYAHGSPQISYQKKKKKKKKKKLVILYVNILTMVTILLTNNCIRMK